MHRVTWQSDSEWRLTVCTGASECAINEKGRTEQGCQVSTVRNLEVSIQTDNACTTEFCVCAFAVRVLLWA